MESAYCIDGGDRLSRIMTGCCKLGEQKVAETTRGSRALHEIGPVTDIDTDKDVVSRALNASVAATISRVRIHGRLTGRLAAGCRNYDLRNRGADIGRRFQHCLDEEIIRAVHQRYAARVSRIPGSDRDLFGAVILERGTRSASRRHQDQRQQRQPRAVPRSFLSFTLLRLKVTRDIFIPRRTC